MLSMKMAAALTERVEEIMPESLDVHLQRGLILIDLGRSGEAESSFLRAYEIRSTHFVAPRMLAQIYEQRGEAEWAARWRKLAESRTEGMEPR